MAKKDIKGLFSSEVIPSSPLVIAIILASGQRISSVMETSSMTLGSSSIINIFIYSNTVLRVTPKQLCLIILYLCRFCLCHSLRQDIYVEIQHHPKAELSKQKEIGPFDSRELRSKGVIRGFVGVCGRDGGRHRIRTYDLLRVKHLWMRKLLNTLSTSELAKLSGLSNSYISQVKSGRRPASKKLLDCLKQVEDSKRPSTDYYKLFIKSRQAMAVSLR